MKAISETFKVLLLSIFVLSMHITIIHADDLDQSGDLDLQDSNLSQILTGSYFSLVKITQEGHQNYAQSVQSGIENQIYITQLGSNNRINSIQIGDNNSVEGKQYGNNNSADIYQFGSNNSAQIEQHGNQYFLVEQYGDHGVISIIQY